MFACVLLPEHLHSLLTLPDGDDDYLIGWANIQRLFTKEFVAAGGRRLPVSLKRAKQREFGIWQTRYWEHRIRDEADWIRHCVYIHLNPFKHGLERRLCDRPWSSLPRHVQLGRLHPHWAGTLPVDLPDVVGG